MLAAKVALEPSMKEAKECAQWDSGGKAFQMTG
jgi:hypothetical protein